MAYDEGEEGDGGEGDDGNGGEGFEAPVGGGQGSASVPGVCCVAYRRNPLFFLVVQSQRSGKWSCPSTRLLPGEEPAKAVKRELLGETGITDYKAKDTGVHLNFVYSGTGELGHQRVFLVEVPANTQVYNGPGITGVQWIQREEFYQFIEYEELRRLLENLAFSF